MALARAMDLILVTEDAGFGRLTFQLALEPPIGIVLIALDPMPRADRPALQRDNQDESRAGGQAKTRPLLEAMEPWLRAALATISQKSKLAEAIRYALARWEGLTRFVDDGTIEIDSNTVERSIRPITLTRKNALFAGSDGGAEHWAVVASLIETCKLNAINPEACRAATLTRIDQGHPKSRIDELLPWVRQA